MFKLTPDQQDYVNTELYVADMGRKYGYGLDDNGDVIPYRFWHSWRWVAVVKVVWFDHVAPVICRRLGHKWEDSGSYAGPDSAWEGFHCTRCRDSFGHQYY